jgi:hypothetical protein
LTCAHGKLLRQSGQRRRFYAPNPPGHRGTLDRLRRGQLRWSITGSGFERTADFIANDDGNGVAVS